MANNDLNISIVESMKMLGSILAIYFTYKIAVLFGLIIYGAVSNVVSGLSLPTVIGTTITALDTSVSAGVTLLESADAFVVGLITLVVIMRLFAPWIKKN